MFIIKTDKKSNIRNLDQKIRKYFLAFFYTIILVYIISILFHHNQMLNFSIFLNLIVLLLVLTISNIYISRILIRKIDINIIGNVYKFTNNDFLLLDDLKINYYLYETIEDYLKNKKKNILDETTLVVNNLTLTDSSLEKKIRYNRKSNKVYGINFFLYTYIRKIYLYNKDASDLKSYSTKSLFLKKIIDLSVIILFIPILIIAVPVSFIVVKNQSSGNFIFRQSRVGKNGKLFKIFKIRTMHQKTISSQISNNSDERRIFNYGKFLRKSRLDELPQFINVLKGDMHIAGPRAEWDYFQEKYTKTIDNYSHRNLVSPGITGFAQVMFRYAHNEEDSREKLMFDLYYIKNWTIWLEIEIGIKTVQVMIDKKGI
tara:strand:- start:129 stop:1244 length:1116 start_codon:yes stop_codon:yes gene_type:complete